MSRDFLLASAAALCLAKAAGAADLSPAAWPVAERARLEALEQSPYPSAARVVMSSRGGEIVSATLSPVAVHAGMQALRQGGTAADAAIAVAFTQTATDLGAVISYAGVAELIYYEAATGRTYAMDAGWASWSGEREPASIPTPDMTLLGGGAGGAGAQGRKTLVPGFMAGMEAAHHRFGRLPFADLLQPAIWYARYGVTVTPLLAFYFSHEKDTLARTPEGRAFLAQAGDALPKAGDRFVQPELAHTLSGVARDGARYMYDGPWASAYVETVRREGGAASLDDLRLYRVVWDEPLSTRYAGATVTGPGVSSTGGCAVLMALNLLDALGGPKLGAPSRDPDSFAVQTRVARFAASESWSPHFAGDCASRMKREWAVATAPKIANETGETGQAGHHSAAVVVVDRWGNVAALVHSINSLMWGETGLVVGGIPIGSPAAVNRYRLVNLAPGARLPTDMAPLIAFRDGRPVAAVASIGASLVPETVRVAAGLLDGEDLAELAAAPPMLMGLGASVPGGEKPALIPTDAYAPQFKAAVEAAGVKLQEVPPAQTAALRGTAAFVRIGPNGASAAEAPSVIVFSEAR